MYQSKPLDRPGSSRTIWGSGWIAGVEQSPVSNFCSIRLLSFPAVAVISHLTTKALRKQRQKPASLSSKISDFRKKLKSNPETAKLLMPGTKYEALLDLNGDGIANFALIDTDHTGEIDTFAIDFQNDGEFDLYLTDTDRSGVPDKVSYYLADGDEPVKGGAAGPRLEELLRPAAMKFIITLRSNFNAENLVEAMKTYKDEVVVTMHAYKDEVNA